MSAAKLDRDRLSPNDKYDMANLAREALQEWRGAKTGSAAERRAARLLAWCVARLDDLGALPGSAAGR